MKPVDGDFTYLKVGDRVHVHYLNLIMRNLLVTEVDAQTTTVEHMYTFDRKTGNSSDDSSYGMHLVRGDTM